MLAALSPAALLSSDLSRARDTADALAAAAGIPAVLDPRLRELHLGTWEGLSSLEARDRHPEEHAAWRRGIDVHRGGGETHREAGERAVACLAEHLPDVRPGGTLVAVTHGGTAKAVVGLLLELPSASWGRLVALGNARWSVLVESDQGWRLERHNTGLTSLGGEVAGGPGRSSSGLPGHRPL